MKDYTQEIENLSDRIKRHLDSITQSSGLPHNDESVRLITINWLDKKKMFEDQISLLEMMEVDHFDINDERGVLLLTYSGSLISISNAVDNYRHIEYASIKLRSDVPDILKLNEAILAKNIVLNAGASFENTPIKTTSAIFKIAVCDENIPVEEQATRIREATIFLTNGFLKLNRTIFKKDENVPDQFNIKSMIRYVAKKNDITIKKARQIIYDYLSLAESGILLQERVSLGKLGKIFLKRRPPRKARVIKHPKTGENITIGAKPETFVPDVSFSKALKDKAKKI